MNRNLIRSKVDEFNTFLVETAYPILTDVNERNALNTIIHDLSEFNKLLSPFGKILVGGFSISNRHDFVPDETVILEILGVKFPFKILPPETMQKNLEIKLKEILSVNNDVLIFVTLYFDILQDRLMFCFAAHSHLVSLGNNSEINMYTEKRKYSFGNVYLNNCFLRYYTANDLSLAPIDDIFKYPLTGFSFNYGFSGDAQKYIYLAAEAMAENGELADLRAFSKFHMAAVEQAVIKLKEKRCKKILTQWSRWTLVGNKYT